MKYFYSSLYTLFYIFKYINFEIFKIIFDRNYDPRNVSPDSRKVVEKLLRERANSFQPNIAKRASTAAAPLAAWVKANVRFSYVLEKVKPLEKEQAKLQR